MRFSNLEPEYLAYLEAQQGCSPSTLRTYRSAFRRCGKASAAAGVSEPDTETIDRRWANQVVQALARELRPRSVHRNIAAWRGMLVYAQQEGYTENNPLVGVKLPKKDAVRRTPVTSDDLQALLDATHRLLNRVRASMARALIVTAATAATRHSDLMPLRVTDIDLAAGILTIRHGKGDKTRTIPLPAQTREALAEWLVVRRRWLGTWPRERRPHQEPDALWLADRGRPLGEGGLRKFLRELCLIAGLGRQVALHDIRHSAATRMARQGMPLVGIQAVLGHSSLATTQGYIAGAGPHLHEWAERMALPAQTRSTEPRDKSEGRPHRIRLVRRLARERRTQRIPSPRRDHRSRSGR